VEHAPPHPDVEGADPQTPTGKEKKGPASAEANAKKDSDAEKRAQQEEKKAKPASDGNEATSEV
jgi:hypothetical protein